MPIYEYACQECGRHHEIMQRITEAPRTECPSCGGELKKMISNTSFVLKGSGWYATDYASKGKKEEPKPSEKKAESGNSAKESSAKTEEKSGSKEAVAAG